jgi:hypothetical protein
MVGLCAFPPIPQKASEWMGHLADVSLMRRSGGCVIDRVGDEGTGCVFGRGNVWRIEWA